MKSVKSAASCQSGLTFWSSLNGQPSLRLFRFENGQNDIYMLVTESRSQISCPISDQKIAIVKNVDFFMLMRNFANFSSNLIVGLCHRHELGTPDVAKIEPNPYFNFGESNSFKYSSLPSSACVLISFPFTINPGFSSGFDFLSGPLTVLIGISVILNQNRLTGVQLSSTRNTPRNIQGFSKTQSIR